MIGPDNKPTQYSGRRYLLIGLFLTAMLSLVLRDFDLQVLRKDFLQDHGDARSLRVVSIPAHRGMILDRNGEPLAISTPVNSIWANPKKVLTASADLKPLADLLDMSTDDLNKLLSERIGREFVYIKRRVAPAFADKVMQLGIPGISLEQEFRRYYPAGEVTAHVIGFTNIDDNGQEGLELAYDNYLKGKYGSKRVLKDRLGRTIENVESIEIPQPGKDLTISIDRRLQYLAYRELKAAVNAHHAHGGTLVMLDAKTGEVLAMVGQPSFNPNNRSDLKSNLYRNRAVTDVFEPGSTIKPFTIAMALQSGIYKPDTKIDTRPGTFTVGGHTIRDTHDYGVIDVSTVIEKSSNVGASKIALSLEPQKLWDVLTKVGFGMTTGSGFPGEASGFLSSPASWSDFEIATISFGYGVSVTALQLASAYQAIADNGMQLPVTFLRTEKPAPGKQIFTEKIARTVRNMLKRVVSSEGTAVRAAVDGYQVAGKTGTVHKAIDGGYSETRYQSLFAGMAPADNPKLVMVVIIDEPQGSDYYGGLVAAPVFSKVMAGALRLLNVTPDNLPGDNGTVVADRSMAAGGHDK